MNQAQKKYKPKFPNAYALLLSRYEISEAKPRDDVDRSNAMDAFESIKDFFRVLVGLKEDGLLTPEFGMLFAEDVEDVINTVHPGYGLGDLNLHHSPIAMGLMNLDRALIDRFA